MQSLPQLQMYVCAMLKIRIKKGKITPSYNSRQSSFNFLTFKKISRDCKRQEKEEKSASQEWTVFRLNWLSFSKVITISITLKNRCILCIRAKFASCKELLGIL